MKNLIYLFIFILLVACTTKKSQESGILVRNIADQYFQRTVETFPELMYFSGIDLDRHDQISSNDLQDIKKWDDFLDSIYHELLHIEDIDLLEQKDQITYWYLKEDLESSIGMRICKKDLWNIDPEIGCQNVWMALASMQAVDNEDHRSQAIQRFEKLPGWMDQEITNLRLGLTQGYSMPKEIVNIVIDQLDFILNFDIEESPFMSAGQRANDLAFASRWKDLVTETVLPTFRIYHDFLKNEYLEQAREDVSILNLPNGAECYAAHIRKYTTSDISGEEIFELGQSIVEANKKAVSKLGSEIYNIHDFSEIINRLRTDSSNYFTSADEILETSERLLQKASLESMKWFGRLPSAGPSIKPYEAHEYGVGAYEQGNAAKAPYFRISLRNPTEQQRGRNEILTFHETFPGHHIQIGIQNELTELHPISKLISFISYMEGWARYAEQLAEEMGLYESKAALISRRAWPARGMVIDPGIHLKGWTKKQAMDYIMESGFNEEMALSLYRRSIYMPGQLTSYDVGGEEIKALRILAEERMGEDFNIKEFHTKILENGSIPLGALREVVVDWIESSQ